MHNLAAKSIPQIVGNIFGLAALFFALLTVTSIGHAARSDLIKNVRVGWGVAAAVSAVLAVLCKRRAVRRCLNKCLEEFIALSESLSEPVGVVVGYSWGGATVTRALMHGHWKGPTLLIASAQDLIASHGGRYLPSLAHLARSVGPVSLIHGKQDTVVPCKHSVRFAETAPAIMNLDVVDGDHFLRQACSSHRLSAMVAQLLISRAQIDRDWAIDTSAANP